MVRLRRYAEWLDSGIKLPGLPWRIGVESLVGLVPGFGDAAGAALSAWIFVAGVRRSVPAATLARMVVNLAIDTLVGAIPVLGDLFDFAWKANARNMALLERQLASPAAAHRADRRFVVVLVAGVVALSAASVLGGLFLLVRLIGLLTGG